jgi:hypothetical protein
VSSSPRLRLRSTLVPSLPGVPLGPPGPRVPHEETFVDQPAVRAGHRRPPDGWYNHSARGSRLGCRRPAEATITLGVNASTSPRPASHRAHNFRSAGLRLTWLCPSALEADNRLDRLLDSVAQRDPRSCPSLDSANGRQRNLQLRVSWSSLHHPPPGAPSPHPEEISGEDSTVPGRLASSTVPPAHRRRVDVATADGPQTIGYLFPSFLRHNAFLLLPYFPYST